MRALRIAVAILLACGPALAATAPQAPTPAYGTNLLRRNSVVVSKARKMMPVEQTSNAAGDSYNEAFELEAPFYAVRFLFFNAETSAKIFGPIKASNVSHIDNAGVILNSAGTWTNVLCSGSATCSIPAGTATRPSYLWTDWTPLTSIPRIDTTATRPVAVVRSFVPASNALFTAGADFSSSCPFFSADQAYKFANRVWMAQHITGDGVTTPTTWPSGSFGCAEWASIVAVQYRSTTKRVITMLEAGDSLTDGALSGWGFGPNNDQTCANCAALGYADDAAVIANNASPSVPVSGVNAGWDGQTSTLFAARTMDLIPLFTPAVLIYSPYSPNDQELPGTDVTELNLASQVLALSDTYRVLDIFTTGIPTTGIGVTRDALRQSVNASIKAMSGAIISDIDAVITDGGSPPAIKAACQAYDSGPSAAPNTTHPNSPCHYAQGQNVAAILSAIIAASLR